jgi:protein ImuB
MARIAAIALKKLRIELAQQLERTAGNTSEPLPLAVVVATEGGAVQNEQNLLGQTRLEDVCALAWQRGVRPGQTLAAARALCSSLRVRVLPLVHVEQALAGLAELALQFGAITAWEAHPHRDMVWVDITGCAHLHRQEQDPVGERTLAQRLTKYVQHAGYWCRVAIAEGPLVAGSLAHYFPEKTKHGVFAPVVVPPQSNHHATRLLPINALSIKPETLRFLTAIGVRRVGDLCRLPSNELGNRLGSEGAHVFRLLTGNDNTPLKAYVPSKEIKESLALDYSIQATQRLLFVVKTLCDRVAMRLVGRGWKATCLELELGLDQRPMTFQTMAVRLPVGLYKAHELLAVFKVKLDNFRIAAPARELSLRVVYADKLVARNLNLFQTEAKAMRELPRLSAEIAAEIGEGRVGTLEMVDTWLPEQRSRLVPYGKPRKKAKVGLGSELCSQHVPEPSRWLRQPLEHRAWRPIRRLQRLAYVNWWQEPSSVSMGNVRDCVAAWSQQMGLVWVEQSPDQRGSSVVRGFFD